MTRLRRLKNTYKKGGQIAKLQGSLMRGGTQFCYVQIQGVAQFQPADFTNLLTPISVINDIPLSNSTGKIFVTWLAIFDKK